MISHARIHVITKMCAKNNRSADETDDPLYADRRNFYKVEKWSRGVKGADMKIIVAAAVLFISLCCCSAYNDRSVHRNLVGPTVVGDGNSVLVSHVRNRADGQQLCRTALQAIWEKRTVQSDGRLTSIFRLPIPIVNVNRVQTAQHAQ
jgi:hypothetical protein